MTVSKSIPIHFEKVLALPEVRSFLLKALAPEMLPDEKYKDWIGFNYSRDRCEGTKFYFTWYREPSPDFLDDLLWKGAAELFYRNHEKRAEAAVLQSYEYGSGYAFGIKVDSDLRLYKAFGYNLKLTAEDYDFLAARNIDESEVMPHKGVYYHFSEDQVYEKNYYYFTGQRFRKSMQELLGIPPELSIPVIEYGAGRGFYKNSSLSDAKFILLGNYAEVWNAYAGSGKMWENLAQDYRQLTRSFGLTGICPGVYDNGRVQSLYLMALDQEGRPLPTIERLRPLLEQAG